MFSTPWRRYWLLAGIAVACGSSLGISDFGLKARLAVCEPWLADYVTAVAPGTVRKERVMVCLFRVDETKEYQGAVYLYMGWGFMEREGLVYFPGAGKPPNPGRIRTEHLYGPWYRFRWRF
jgi:hypothetical protein